MHSSEENCQLPTIRKSAFYTNGLLCTLSHLLYYQYSKLQLLDRLDFDRKAWVLRMVTQYLTNFHINSLTFKSMRGNCPDPSTTRIR